MARMTKTHTVETAKAYQEWWTGRGIDTVFEGTWDPKRSSMPTSHNSARWRVEHFLSDMGYMGLCEGVVEKNTCGDWHFHAALQGGLIPNDVLRSAWYSRHGFAVVRKAGRRECESCDRRDRCSMYRYLDIRKRGESLAPHRQRGCGDLHYIAMKMHMDCRDGGAIIELPRGQLSDSQDTPDSADRHEVQA